MGERTQKYKIKAQLKKDDTVARVQAHHLTRWCKFCGVDDPRDIDYDNSFVKIEYLLCDPLWLHAIKNEKGRQEFKERLNDPIAWWIFCNWDPEDEPGKGYFEKLAHGNLILQMKGAYRHMRRRKDGTPTGMPIEENRL